MLDVAQSIQATPTVGGFFLTRPGARYAVASVGAVYWGAWLDDAAPLEPGWSAVFSELEARELLPLLRCLEDRAAEADVAGSRPALGS